MQTPIDPHDRKLARIVTDARMRARVRTYNGLATRENMRLIGFCTTDWRYTPWSGNQADAVRMAYTRDDGMHDIGWWKNPLYSRCLHLSLSFVGLTRSSLDPREALRAVPLPQKHAAAHAICLAFYGDQARKLWIEPPYTDVGKAHDVYHYRLFMTENFGEPVELKGEVYTLQFTAKGWKSWSELHPPGAYGLENPP